MRFRVALLSVLVLAGSFAALPARAAQLLMLEQPGCSWCRKWNAEIGPAYPKTEEGQIAPLRRVDITEPWPEDLDDVARERMTPTFVLLDDEGREVGRMRGYAGDEFFWVLLGQMLDELPSTRRN